MKITFDEIWGPYNLNSESDLEMLDFIYSFGVTESLLGFLFVSKLIKYQV